MLEAFSLVNSEFGKDRLFSFQDESFKFVQLIL